MDIPRTEVALIRFVKDIIERCDVSRGTRRMNYKAYRTLFYTGAISGIPSKNNKCFSHVDKLSSYLYSSVDVRFDLELERGNPGPFAPKLSSASRYLNRKFRRTSSDITFGAANTQSLVDGAAIVKQTWKNGRYEPWLILPEFFGVYREDIEDLSRQEAFTHTFFVLPDALKRMLHTHHDKAQIVERAKNAATADNAAIMLDGFIHEMITAGQIGVAGVNTPAPSTSIVGVVGMQAAQLAPEVVNDLIRVDDVWVWNDRLQDWTTFRFVEPDILLEGKFQHRNLSDAPKRHPFVKVCSNTVPNYFWGRSELASVLTAQDQITKRMNNVDQIFELQARPPRAMSGFQGINEEKARALLMPGGALVEGATGAKVENLAPDMPDITMSYLDKLEAIFDETAGFTNILSGQGEPGIRAGVHAGALLRTSSARLADRALLIERQCSDFADLSYNISRAKEADILVAEDGSEFMLSQLPADTYAAVDSHSSSPAFIEDNKQLLFGLAKAGAIGPEDLIEGTHPPRQDILLQNFKRRQEAERQMLMSNPAALEALQGKKKK